MAAPQRKFNPSIPKNTATRNALRAQFRRFPWAREQDYVGIAASLGIINVDYVRNFYANRRARPEIQEKLVCLNVGRPLSDVACLQNRRSEARRLRKLAQAGRAAPGSGSNAAPGQFGRALSLCISLLLLPPPSCSSC